MTLSFFRPAIWGVALCGLIILTPMASALAVTFDDIIVTSTKRAQKLQDVAVAVSVTDGATIEDLQIIDLVDWQGTVPSFRLVQLQSSANANFIIRGFGNGANNPGIEPSVGVYIDGVYRSRPGAALADLPSIDRIELIRGPQSTLFGKNASAGVIAVTTQLPDDEFSGFFEMTGGEYNTILAKGNITGPLSDNTAFRLSGSSYEADGYYDNIGTGAQMNDRNRWQMRGQILSQLGDNTTMRLIADYNSLEEVCCGASTFVSGGRTAILNNVAAGFGLPVSRVPVDSSERTSGLSYDPESELEGKGLSAQFDVALAGMKFTSITSYREQLVYSNSDADFNLADVVSSNQIKDDYETFTQEFRLQSDNDSAFHWMIGGYYFDEDINHYRDVIYGSAAYAYFNTLVQAGSGCFEATPAAGCSDLAGLAAGLSLLYGLSGDDVLSATDWFIDGVSGVVENFTMQNEALSLFAQFDYDISDQLRASLGVNYTEDEKTVVSMVNITDALSALDFDRASATAAAVGMADLAEDLAEDGDLRGLQIFPPFTNYPNDNENGEFNSDDFTYSLSLSYDLNDETTLYVSHATGFKAASVNLSVDARELRFAEPEEATSIEIGIKKNMERGFVNFSIFEQEIDNFQNNLFNGLGFDLINAGKQVHAGVEIDGAYNVSNQLTLTYAGTYIDPEFETHTDEELAGKAPGGVHEVSMTLGATYDHQLMNKYDAYLRFEYVYESDVQVVDNVPKDVASREVNLLNASYAVADSEQGWSVRLWARNLTDEDYIISAFPTTAQTGSFSGYISQPRTFGLAIRQRF